MSSLVLTSTAKFAVLAPQVVPPPPPPVVEKDWNAAAPKSYVSNVLSETVVRVTATSEEEDDPIEDDWVVVDEEPKTEEPPTEDLAQEEKTVGDWVEYVDPATKHPYWYNAKDGRSSWEPPNDLDALRVEMEYLRTIQTKLVDVVTAMHHRFADIDSSREPRPVTAVDRQTEPSIADYANEQRPVRLSQADENDPKARDQALTAALRAEERRFFQADAARMSNYRGDYRSFLTP